MSVSVIRTFAEKLANVCNQIKQESVDNLLQPSPAVSYSSDVYRGRYQAAEDLLAQIEYIYKDVVKAHAGEL